MNVDFRLAYSPIHPGLADMLEGVARTLNLDTAVAFNDTNQLQIGLTQNPFLAGIEFADAPEYHSTDPNALPRVLDYALRFPGGLRTGRVNQAIFNWYTQRLFPVLQYPGPRNRDGNDGGQPTGYLQEGFLAVQNSIAQEFLRMQSNGAQNMPEVNLQVSIYSFFNFFS